MRNTLYYHNTRNYRSETNIKNTFSSIAMNISIIYRPDLLSSDEIKLPFFFGNKTQAIYTSYLIEGAIENRLHLIGFDFVFSS